MSDTELTRALERGDVPNAGFRHADHLRVALVYLNESPTIGDAIDRMAATLRRFAASVGQPHKYSQATTEFWVHQVAAVRAVMPDAPADTLFAAFPRLLDKRLILANDSDNATATGTTHSPRDTPNRSLSGDTA